MVSSSNELIGLHSLQDTEWKSLLVSQAIKMYEKGILSIFINNPQGD